MLPFCLEPIVVVLFPYNWSKAGAYARDAIPHSCDDADHIVNLTLACFTLFLASGVIGNVWVYVYDRWK